jgi:hypothetical protein
MNHQNRFYMSLFVLLSWRRHISLIWWQRLQLMSSIDEDSGRSAESSEIPLPTLLLAEITAKAAGYSQ